MSYMKPQQGNRLVIHVLKCSHGLNPCSLQLSICHNLSLTLSSAIAKKQIAMATPGRLRPRTRNMTGTGLNCLLRFLQVQDGVWSAG